MQLTLQLPTCSHGLDSPLETSSNASSGTSTPSWTSSFEAGPPTPAGQCAALQDTTADADSAADQQNNRRGVYRRLQLEVPCSPGMHNDSSSCPSSARRVLPITGSYSAVCSWLDQQVSKRDGTNGGLIAARSHSPVGLLPAFEAPITPTHIEEATAALPAPAFQLLGLL